MRLVAGIGGGWCEHFERRRAHASTGGWRPSWPSRKADLTEVACVDVPSGEKRPEFGCFNVGVATGLHFSQASVYWHLRAFPSRKAAEAAKSATGIVVEEDGRVWLSEFGPRNTAPRGGEAIAVVDLCSFPQQRATLRFSRTLSCGPATIQGCIHTRAPKGGTC